MAQHISPTDLAVAIHLATASGTFQTLAKQMATSASQVHKAVARLQSAGLVLPESRQVNRAALLEFLTHGVRYAFAVQPGRPTLGIPTAHSAPPLDAEIDAVDACVWPSPDGDTIGRGIRPLYPGAVHLRERAPETYRLLALVDAIRVGGARERALAVERIAERLRLPARAA